MSNSKKPSDPTACLEAHARGQPGAAERLMPQVYDKLRALAGKYLGQERPGHTLQPTALVHEAYLRLIDVDRVDWQGRTHFYAMAARQMRRILIEHARRGSAKKRGERPQRVSLVSNIGLSPEPSLDLIALDQALDQLAEESARQAEVVELRLFGGLSLEEAGTVLGVSPHTVKRDWRLARAKLARKLDLSRGD